MFDLKSIEKIISKDRIKKHTDVSTGLGTNTMESNSTKIALLELGKLKFKNKKFMLLDLSHINETYTMLKKTTISGVIGGDILEKYNAVIDYKKMIMTLKIK